MCKIIARYDWSTSKYGYFPSAGFILRSSKNNGCRIFVEGFHGNSWTGGKGDSKYPGVYNFCVLAEGR